MKVKNKEDHFVAGTLDNVCKNGPSGSLYLVTFMLLTNNCVNNVLQETIIFYLKRYVIDYFFE